MDKSRDAQGNKQSMVSRSGCVRCPCPLTTASTGTSTRLPLEGSQSRGKSKVRALVTNHPRQSHRNRFSSTYNPDTLLRLSSGSTWGFPSHPHGGVPCTAPSKSSSDVTMCIDPLNSVSWNKWPTSRPRAVKLTSRVLALCGNGPSSVYEKNGFESKSIMGVVGRDEPREDGVVGKGNAEEEGRWEGESLADAEMRVVAAGAADERSGGGLCRDIAARRCERRLNSPFEVWTATGRA
jgi:hypothetical protein